MAYIICTGFFHKPDKEDLAIRHYWRWHENVLKYAEPERIVVLGNGGCRIPMVNRALKVEVVHLSGNLGHTHDLTNHIKPHAMCGWSAAFVTLAMIAYSNETDFVFKEQDCLAFGPWVERMYAEIGSKGMLFGNSKTYACAQSLCLIKHDFIPEFVRLYMGTGNEQSKDNECELKFARLEQEHPDLFGRFSFGCDRDRPIPYDDEVFYCQQLSPIEIDDLRVRKLI